jgi:hypothetical protein
MTKFFMFAALLAGLVSLAAGWLMAGYWSMGLALLGVIPLSFFLVFRKFQPILSLVLAITVFTAALGLWVNINLSLALTAVVCILAAWDLDGFSRRLVFASAEDNPAQIERGHLGQVGLMLVMGVAIILVVQSIKLVFGFEWVLVLAIAAFIGISALVSQ